MKLFKEGKIDIKLLITIVLIVAGAVATAYAMKSDLEENIGTVKAEVSRVSERTAKLETVVPEIKDDISDIKESVQRMETYFRIPQPKTQ